MENRTILENAYNVTSLLKYVHADDFNLLCVLHLRSDFDAQKQTDEIIWSFSTFWFFLRRMDELRSF